MLIKVVYCLFQMPVLESNDKHCNSNTKNCLVLIVKYSKIYLNLVNVYTLLNFPKLENLRIRHFSVLCI